MKKATESKKYTKLIGWLRDSRLERGLTQRQLAAQMKIGHTYIHKIEANERRLDVYEYVVYCEALRVDPAVGMQFLATPVKTKNK